TTETKYGPGATDAGTVTWIVTDALVCAFNDVTAVEPTSIPVPGSDSVDRYAPTRNAPAAAGASAWLRTRAVTTNGWPGAQVVGAVTSGTVRSGRRTSIMPGATRPLFASLASMTWLGTSATAERK